jgi:drug/metabolite transporter (DMT)-like permease
LLRNHMATILYALISCFGWGIGDILGTISVRKLGVFSMSFWATLFSVILFLFYVPLEISNLNKLSFELFLMTIGLSITVVIAGLSFAKALTLTNPAIASSVVSSSNGLTVLFSILILGEILNFYQGIAIFIILIGIVLVTAGARKIKGALGRSSLVGIGFALISMICFAVEKTFIKYPVKEIGWFWPTFIIYGTFVLVLLTWALMGNKISHPNKNNALVPLFLSVIFARAADFSFSYAVGKGLTSIVAPIAGASPAVVVIFALLFFKDPITKLQLLGIFISLVGIVFLSSLSV